MYQVAGATLTNAAWASANDPVAIPFTFWETVTVYKLAMQNGSSPGDNFDIGIYDENWVRKVSAGSTAATSSWQVVDIADTVIGPGRYWLVLVRDTTTASRCGFYTVSFTVASMAFAGLFDSATDAFPLPDPLTNMAAVATATRPPIVGIYTRA